MEFTDVFIVAKRSGGNYISIIQSTVYTISNKIEIKNEIDTFLSGKKYEQKIMSLVPPAIIAFVDFSSPGLLNSLYHNYIGISVMTGCLVLYLVALLISKKIMDIEI